MDNKKYSHTIPKFDKKFFATHEISKYSAANIYFYCIDYSLDEIFDSFEQTAKEKGFNIPDRSEELSEIQSLTDPLAIVNYMRTLTAMPNRNALVEKVKEYSDSTMPLIINRYMTSGLDHFIEIAGHCFIKNDAQYLSELKKRYPEIRNPYAKAVACLVFSMRGIECDGEFLYGEYLKFQRMYPDESYEDFPLLGLHILYENNML